MSNVITEFTAEVPHWRPYVTPVALESATPAQREAMKITPSNQKISEYTLVLAHDPESLQYRSPLFNDIMFHRGGLSRAERELGAVGASLVNRCIYCAAVHAARYNQLTKDESVMTRIFADETEATLDPRRSAILAFSAKLSKCPSAADSSDIQALADAGLTPEEILDLVLSVALFGWANRLMHTLGEPVAHEDSAAD
tara:strand:- start:251 stop:844 length:594 start_codon:yes stop_codon:yes gene_type:complete